MASVVERGRLRIGSEVSAIVSASYLCHQRRLRGLVKKWRLRGGSCIHILASVLRSCNMHRFPKTAMIEMETWRFRWMPFSLMISWRRLPVPGSRGLASRLEPSLPSRAALLARARNKPSRTYCTNELEQAWIEPAQLGSFPALLPMLSPCRWVRLRFCHRRFASALAFAPADASTSTSTSDSDFDRDPDSQCPIASPLLRRRMREAAAEGDILAALDALGCLWPAPSACDYNALLHAYLRSSSAMPDHIAVMISHMCRLGPAPNAITFNTAFNGLLRLGHLDAAHAVLEKMWSDCGFVPSFTAVDRLIKKAVSGADFDLALKMKVLDLMLRLNYLPTLPVANAIVSVLVKSDGAEMAYELFLVLLNRGFWPDMYMYSQILFGLCKSGRSSKALALFCNLRKRGLSLNVYSYTALVFGFCKEKLWDEAYKAMVMMCHEGCEPSVVTYTVVVNFLCKDMKTDDAMRVFKMAYEEGCHLDITICNVLLHALCCIGRVLEALVIIDVMEEAGFVPDCFTISALAAGFLKTGHAKACQNFVEMVFTKGNVIDVVTWNIYLHSLCRDGQVRKAYALVNSMEEKGYLVSTVTYNILKGFCMDMDLQKALQMLDRFSSAGVCYDFVSFNTILSAACRHRCGKFAESVKIVENLIVDGNPLFIRGG